jgi:hypothetical protein
MMRDYYRGQSSAMQAHRVIDAWQLGFNLGCVLKYCCRAGLKAGSSLEDDLQKALDYIDFEIDFLDRIKTGKQRVSFYATPTMVCCKSQYMPDEVAEEWGLSEGRRRALKLIFKASLRYREGLFESAIEALEDLIPVILEERANG